MYNGRRWSEESGVDGSLIQWADTTVLTTLTLHSAQSLASAT